MTINDNYSVIMIKGGCRNGQKSAVIFDLKKNCLQSLKIVQ